MVWPTGQAPTRGHLELAALRFGRNGDYHYVIIAHRKGSNTCAWCRSRPRCQRDHRPYEGQQRVACHLDGQRAQGDNRSHEGQQRDQGSGLYLGVRRDHGPYEGQQLGQPERPLNGLHGDYRPSEGQQLVRVDALHQALEELIIDPTKGSNRHRSAIVTVPAGVIPDPARGQMIERGRWPAHAAGASSPGGLGDPPGLGCAAMAVLASGAAGPGAWAVASRCQARVSSWAQSPTELGLSADPQRGARARACVKPPDPLTRLQALALNGPDPGLHHGPLHSCSQASGIDSRAACA